MFTSSRCLPTFTQSGSLVASKMIRESEGFRRSAKLTNSDDFSGVVRLQSASKYPETGTVGAIIGGIIAAILVMLFVTGIVIFLRHRNSSTEPNSQTKHLVWMLSVERARSLIAGTVLFSELCLCLKRKYSLC
jgi:Ca2+/Na+ antiporter